MKKGSLKARLATIEAARLARAQASPGTGPLSAAERDELERLFGPRPNFEAMSEAEVDQWLHENSIEGDPHPERTARIRALQARETQEQSDERLIRQGYVPWRHQNRSGG